MASTVPLRRCVHSPEFHPGTRVAREFSLTTLPVVNVGYRTRKSATFSVPATHRRGTGWQSSRVWVLALVVVQGLLCVRVNAKEQALDHKTITLAVETALVNEGGVPGHLIDVNTRDGVVTLSEWVDNLLAKEGRGGDSQRLGGRLGGTARRHRERL